MPSRILETLTLESTADEAAAAASEAPALPRRLQREYDVSRARSVTVNEMEERLTQLRDGMDPPLAAESVPPDPVEADASLDAPDTATESSLAPTPATEVAAPEEEAPPYQEVDVELPSETCAASAEAAPAQADVAVEVTATTETPANVAAATGEVAPTLRADVAAQWARAATLTAPLREVTPLYPTAELDQLHQTAELNVAVPSAPLTRPEEQRVSAPAATAPPVAVAPAASAPAQEAAINAWTAHVAPMTPAERLQRYNNLAIAAERERGRAFHSHHFDPRHPLFALVETYRTARVALRASTTQLAELKDECDTIESRVWLREKVTSTFNGRCADGRGVSATHEHEKMSFVEERSMELADALNRRREAIFDSHLLMSFQTRMKRYHVREYLQSVVADANVHRIEPDNAPAAGSEKAALFAESEISPDGPVISESYRSSRAVQSAEQIRGCLDVLFAFARGDYDDPAFKVENHEWLRYMTSALYQVGAAEDYRFVLHHISRCRNGDGRMLRGLVCVPQRTQWTDAVLDHLLASVWIIVAQDPTDSEGGDEGSGSWLTMEDALADSTQPLLTHSRVLGDSDVMALVDELPVEDLFAHVLDANVWRRGEASPLDMLAFVDYLFGVLREAFAVAQRRGHEQIQLQVADMCGKLTKAVARTWGDAAERPSDSTTSPRVQAEMNDLFERAVMWFREVGTWRFLPQLKYNALSFPSACRMATILYAGASSPRGMSEEERLRYSGLPTFEGLARERFVDLMQQGSPQESTHMLRALTQLAISRTPEFDARGPLPPHEAELVRQIGSELFHVTCVNPGTRETLSRDGRDLFAEFAEQYPPIVSDLIAEIDRHAGDIGKAAMYIFSNLPLERWEVTDSDINQIQVWLCGSTDDTRFIVAKHIMTTASWRRRRRDGELVINTRVQLRAAIALARAYSNHGPQHAKSTFSSQIGKLLPTAVDEAFGAWCWSVLLTLQLWHGHGLPTTSLQADLAVSDLSVHPVHAYVAMMAETATRTFTTFAKWLQILADNGHFEAALVALHCGVPDLIATSGFQLIANEKFLSVIGMLVNADRTVFSFAERLSVHLVSTVYESHMKAVIHDHVNRPDNGRLLAEFWLRSIFSVPMWNTDYVCRRLVNEVLEAMFRHPDGRILVQSLLSKEHVRQSEIAARAPKSVFAVLASMVSSDTPSITFIDGDADAAELCKSWGSWIRNGGALSNEFSAEGLSVWLILESLFMETCQERDVRHAVAGPLVAGVKLSIATRQYKRSDEFTIYNWARFCGTLPPGTPALPLFWQMFFCLFFEKHVVNDRGATATKGFGHLFFVGQPKTVLTRLHTRLQLLRDFHKQAMDSEEGGAEHHARVQELYENMSLWLEEERFLHLDARQMRDPSLDIQRLLSVTSIAPWDARDGPYNAWWLDCIENGALETPWDVIRPLSVVGSAPSRNGRSRGSRQSPPASPSRSVAIVKAPGPLVETHGLVKQCDNPQVFPDLLRGCIEVLRQEISRYSARASQATALDAEFIEQLPAMHVSTNTPYSQLVPCRRILGGACTGPAAINYDIPEFTVANSVFQMLKSNRDELDALMTEVQLPADVFTAAYAMQRAFIRLVELEEAHNHRMGPAHNDDLTQWKQNGRTAFYMLAHTVDSSMEMYSPTRSLLRSEIQRLARTFITPSSEHQRRVLDVAIESSQPEIFLEGYQPHRSPGEFVDMYSRAAEMKILPLQHDCETLLKCFDTRRWLDDDNATLTNREALIEVIAAAVGTGAARPGQPLSGVLRIHLRNADILLRHQFPECLTTVLHNVLDLGFRDVAPLEWWLQIHSSIVDDAGQKFTSRHALQLGAWIAPWLSQMRQTHGALDTHLRSSFEPLCRLLQLIVGRFTAEDCAVPFHEQFLMLRRLYSPLLCPADGPPWGATPEGSKLGRCAARSLVASTSTFQNRDAALHALWSFYAEEMVTRNALHVLDELHDALSGAGWEGLHISHPLLIQMNDVVMHRDVYSGSVLLAFKILASVRWPLRAPEDSDQHALAEFQNQLLTLLLAVCSERRVVETPTYGKFWEMITSDLHGEWAALSIRSLEDACAWARDRLDHTLMFVPGSPTWHATLLLRRVAHDTGAEGAQHSGPAAFQPERWAAHTTLMLTLMNKAGNVITAKQVATYMADSFRRLESAFQGKPESLPIAQPTLCLLTAILNAPVCAGDGGIEVASAMMSIVQASPMFAIPVLSATCATVAVQSLVATLAEHCAKIHLEFATADPKSAEFGWNPIVSRLVVPELDYEVFVAVTIENRCWRVLYAHTVQLVRRAGSDSTKELAIATAIVGWLDQATQIASTDESGDVRNLLLLYGTAVKLVAQQSSRGLGPLRVGTMLHTMAESLSKLCEERASGGLLGAIGFGARSSLPADFRLVCRGLGYKIDHVLSTTPELAAVLPKGSAQVRSKRIEKHELALVALLKQRSGEEQFGELVRCVQGEHSAQAPRTVPSIASFAIELIAKAYPTDPALVALFST